MRLTYFGITLGRIDANGSLLTCTHTTATLVDSGTVTSDTGGGAPGWPVSVTLANQFGGQTINLNAGKASGLYCAPAIAKMCG